MIRKGIFCLVLIILLLAGIVVGYSVNDQQGGNGVTPDGVVIPVFSEIEIDFEHSYSGRTSLPYMAAAIIDVDNDGREEIFIGGGVRQSDGLFRFKNGRFSNISEEAKLIKLGGDATYGAVVLDVDANGYSDLIVSRDSGVWLYTNKEGIFTGKNLEIPMSADTVPLSVALCDINRDGAFDMYVSGHVKKELLSPFPLIVPSEHSGESVLLLNNGDNTFLDITATAGLSGESDSFQGIFVDIDGDSLEDLVTTRRGESVVLWKNQGDITFQRMPNPNTSEKSYTKGIGVGDVNNDGLMDLFFTNIGSTLPTYIGQKLGDVNKDFNSSWIVLINRGDFQFEDVSKKMKMDGFQFSQGAILEDVNLDGMQDLIVSENSPEWPPHLIAKLRLNDRLLLQTPRGEFADTSHNSGIVSKKLGVSPLTADINGDGAPDVVFVSLDGRATVYLSENTEQRFLKVKLPDMVSSIGAMVRVETLGGASLYKQFISGEGFCSDQSHMLVFGLGNDVAVNIIVTFSGKEPQRVSGEVYDSVVTF